MQPQGKLLVDFGVRSDGVFPGQQISELGVHVGSRQHVFVEDSSDVLQGTGARKHQAVVLWAPPPMDFLCLGGGLRAVFRDTCGAPRACFWDAQWISFRVEALAQSLVDEVISFLNVLGWHELLGPAMAVPTRPIVSASALSGWRIGGTSHVDCSDSDGGRKGSVADSIKTRRKKLLGARWLEEDERASVCLFCGPRGNVGRTATVPTREGVHSGQSSNCMILYIPRGFNVIPSIQLS